MKRTVHSLGTRHSPYLTEAHALARGRVAVRGERVQHIKEQIHEGTYEVRAEGVVRSIARSELFWLFRMDYMRACPAPHSPPI